MKATGIVRRIDDLGRIVIPKEIRRTMRIREGDPLEIYTDNNGEVIFKKYSPIGELGEVSVQLAEALSRETGQAIVITDRDHCIACAGISKKEVLERRISPQCEDIMENRKTVFFNGGEDVFLIEGVEQKAAIISTIISGGDVSGAVIMLESGKQIDKSDEKLCSSAAVFLGMQLEN